MNTKRRYPRPANPLHRSMRFLLAAGAVVLTVASEPTWAQDPGRVPGEDGGVLQWCIAAGLILVIGLTAFLNPKRSHLT